MKPFPFDSLLLWYKTHGRHELPWRQIYDRPLQERLYKVWIAEVMLQQTQVDRVIGYYVRFLEKYPTMQSLAKTTYEELFPYYQGLGYYGRARRMIELAQIITRDYDGIFPDNEKKLSTLPGIGTYTAQAILAFGYDKPVLAIDANLAKIFSRYYYGYKQSPLNKKMVEQLNQSLIRRKNIISGRDINNALMDFGAMTSTNIRQINRDTYPLVDCLWMKTHGEKEIKKITKIHKKVSSKYACLVYLHTGHTSYWSSKENEYEPFLVEPISGDDRVSIQDYFESTYGLIVSVRPSFGDGILGKLGDIQDLFTKKQSKTIVSNELQERISVRLFHAQIQIGNNTFKEFTKNIKNNWHKTHVVVHK